MAETKDTSADAILDNLFKTIGGAENGEEDEGSAESEVDSSEDQDKSEEDNEQDSKSSSKRHRRKEKKKSKKKKKKKHRHRDEDERDKKRQILRSEELIQRKSRPMSPPRRSSAGDYRREHYHTDDHNRRDDRRRDRDDHHRRQDRSNGHYRDDRRPRDDDHYLQDRRHEERPRKRHREEDVFWDSKWEAGELQREAEAKERRGKHYLDRRRDREPKPVPRSSKKSRSLTPESDELKRLKEMKAITSLVVKDSEKYVAEPADPSEFEWNNKTKMWRRKEAVVEDNVEPAKNESLGDFDAELKRRMEEQVEEGKRRPDSNQEDSKPGSHQTLTTDEIEEIRKKREKFKKEKEEKEEGEVASDDEKEKSEKRSSSKHRQQSSSRDHNRHSRSYEREQSYDKRDRRRDDRDRERRRDDRQRDDRDRERRRDDRHRDDRYDRRRSPTRSRYDDYRSSSRHFYKDYRDRHRSRSRSRERRRSNDFRSSRAEIDKAKLLAIARKNAVKLLNSDNLMGMDHDRLLAIKSGGQSLAQLTMFCRELARKGITDEFSDDEIINRPFDSDEDNNDSNLHHPFQVKERAIPNPFTMGEDRALELSQLTPQAKLAARSHRMIEFPVSSGNAHRVKEVVKPEDKEESPPAKEAKAEVDPMPDDDDLVNEKPPEDGVAKTNFSNPLGVIMFGGAVDPKSVDETLIGETKEDSEEAKPKALTFVPAETTSENSEKTDKVFEAVAGPSKEIGDIVTQRLSAMKKLSSNPNDPEALREMYEAQKEMSSWAESKNKPGQFTGHTGAKVLSKAELELGVQAWAKQEQFTRAPKVQGGFGEFMLRKMGWSDGEGLGKDRSGDVDPLTLDIKMDKKGLLAAEEAIYKRKKGNVLTMTGVDLSGKHPVTALMELSTRRRWGAPSFVQAFECGPPHKKQYIFKVSCDNNSW